MTDVVHTRPIAMLVDRSRDWFSAAQLVFLEPDDEFMTTDSRQYLSARLLAGYDVVGICGISALRYRRDELAALKKFVLAGGGLILGTCVGRAEQSIGCSAEELTANQIGKLFGIRFLSPGDAKQRLQADAHGILGFKHREVSFAKVRALSDLKPTDLPIRRASPIEVPKGAKVILKSRRTGEPVAALWRYGKGKVLALGDLAVTTRCNPALAKLVRLVAPASRRRKERPPALIDLPRKTVRRGDIQVRYAALAKDRVATVFRLTRKIRQGLADLFAADKVLPCRVTLSPGSSGGRDWECNNQVCLSLGSELTDARLASAIGQAMGSYFLSKHPVRHIMHEGLQWDAASHYLWLKAMEWGGFQREAARWKQHYRSEAKVDIRQAYPWACHLSEVEKRLLNLWVDAEEEFGTGAFKKFLKVIPKKKARSGFYWPIFGELEIWAYYLSLALRKDVFSWLEKRGTTVHRLPRVRKNTRKFKQGVKDYLQRLVEDDKAAASERLDAALALVQLQTDAKVCLDEAARQTRSRKASVRIPSAMRLALTKDERGLTALRKALDGGDPALSAIAAYVLVQSGDSSAAPRLAELALQFEPRFQLAARYVLELRGRGEARRFALERIKDAKGRRAFRLKVGYDGREGELKVFPMVEDREVANVFSGRVVEHFPYNTHVRSLYILWVHTSGWFRRRGLARLALEKTLSHSWARGMSTSHLWTGTENVAHTLYRNLGFVDVYLGRDHNKNLAWKELVKPPKGIRITTGRPADEAEAVKLMNKCCEKFMFRPRRVQGWPPQVVVKLAWKGSELVGYAYASVGGARGWSDSSDNAARLREFCVKEDKKRAEIGVALLSSVHNQLLTKGIKKAKAWDMPDDDFSLSLLGRAGYACRLNEDVLMRRVNDLASFFEEILPLLMRRLKDGKLSNWQGSIAFRGQRLQATLVMKKGKLRVRRMALPGASITLIGSDTTVSQVVFGVRTAFETYLQDELKVRPMMNRPVHKLLDCLFPKTRRMAGQETHSFS